MPPPEAFRRFCLMFHQDIGLTAATLDEAIDDALGTLDAAERHALRDFLSRALVEPDSALEELWVASPADVFLRAPSQVRRLFSETLKRLLTA